MKTLRLLTLLACAGGVLGFGSVSAQTQTERPPVQVPASPRADAPYERAAPVEFIQTAPTNNPGHGRGRRARRDGCSNCRCR